MFLYYVLYFFAGVVFVIDDRSVITTRELDYCKVYNYHRVKKEDLAGGMVRQQWI